MRFVRAGLVLAAAVIGLAHPAAAADMPMPGKAVSAPVFSWTGFYAGVHAGWGWNDPTGTSVITEAGISELAAQHNLDANGPLFGGHMGYNWQVNQRWVVGIEGDITGTGIKASSAVSAVCPAPACVPPQPMPGALAAMSQDVNWLASVRGRLGTTWGAGLIYVTGGVAWANVDYKANAGDPGQVCSNNGCALPASSNNTKTGWTVGGGYETALIGNWTVRAEYLYYSFGGETLTAAASPATNCTTAFGIVPPCSATYTFSDLKIHTARLGVSYKF
jgi:outer membrane immunogenic protein